MEDLAICNLIDSLRRVKTLRNLFISVDGIHIDDPFTKKIIDRMTKCT